LALPASGLANDTAMWVDVAEDIFALWADVAGSSFNLRGGLVV